MDIPVHKERSKEELEAFLQSAVDLVREESGTTAWFALRMGPHEFAIFDAFPDESGRSAHLKGKVAESLFAKDLDLLAEEPEIHKIEVLAEKLPGMDSSRGLPDEVFAP